jgi:endoglucanase
MTLTTHLSVNSIDPLSIELLQQPSLNRQSLSKENSYTGAWEWISSGTDHAMAALTDLNDNVIYEMDQYLDSNGSGTSFAYVSSAIAQERLEAAINWCRSHGRKMPY